MCGGEGTVGKHNTGKQKQKILYSNILEYYNNILKNRNTEDISMSSVFLFSHLVNIYGVTHKDAIPGFSDPSPFYSYIYISNLFTSLIQKKKRYRERYILHLSRINYIIVNDQT